MLVNLIYSETEIFSYVSRLDTVRTQGSKNLRKQLRSFARYAIYLSSTVTQPGEILGVSVDIPTQ